MDVQALIRDDLGGDIAAGNLGIAEHEVLGVGQILHGMDSRRVALGYDHDHDIGGKHLGRGNRAILHRLIHGLFRSREEKIGRGALAQLAHQIGGAAIFKAQIYRRRELAGALSEFIIDDAGGGCSQDIERGSIRVLGGGR